MDRAQSGSRGLGTGHLVSLAGAAAALGSLWAPWYKLDIASVLPAMNAQADRILTPAAAQQLHTVSDMLPPSVTVDAWTVFHHNDIIIATVAGLVALIVLATAGTFGDGVRVDPRIAGRVCTSLGVLCTLLVGYQITTHMKTPAGVPSSAISLQWGGYLCLAAAAAMLVGGLMARSALTRAPDSWAPPAANRWAPPTDARADTWTPPSTDGWATPVVNADDEAARRTTSVAPPGMLPGDVA